MTSTTQQPQHDRATEHHDAVIIGAGVSGMYALHHLREMGLSVRAYDGPPRAISGESETRSSFTPLYYS